MGNCQRCCTKTVAGTSLSRVSLFVGLGESTNSKLTSLFGCSGSIKSLPCHNDSQRSATHPFRTHARGGGARLRGRWGRQGPDLRRARPSRLTTPDTVCTPETLHPSTDVSWPHSGLVVDNTGFGLSLGVSFSCEPMFRSVFGRFGRLERESRAGIHDPYYFLPVRMKHLTRLIPREKRNPSKNRVTTTFPFFTLVLLDQLRVYCVCPL